MKIDPALTFIGGCVIATVIVGVPLACWAQRIRYENKQRRLLTKE